MRPVVISRRAAADLQEIGSFIAADNPARARSFVAALRERCHGLGRMPLKGRAAREIGPNIRILVFRAYLILHRVTEDKVVIDRVLHAARDRPILPPNG